MGTTREIKGGRYTGERQVQVVYLPLSSLKSAKRNPKRHSVDTVLKSIYRFGYAAPVIVDEGTGRLVAGVSGELLVYGLIPGASRSC